MTRTVGPFEILEPLGAGGMGEVFKARDTRLNRFVAIKFLPEGATSAARERFQREALAIAALNHPHICTLHEVGEHDRQPYLVMELLEGESLFHRLARGAVTPAETAQWGAEIADALQAAHAKGILHRDLKPGNIFITRRGSVKVLDFGLAQITAAAVSSEDAPTAVAGPLTTPGALLGTYAYMAPEQARGQATDARSDIFSLGVVLYEMAAGRPPFQGRTPADLSAAILMQTPPPPSSIRPPGSGEVPARLDDTIAQCLEKDPDQRYQSAADLRISLRRQSGSTAPPSSVAAPPPSAIAPPAAPRRRWLAPVVIVAIIAIAGGAWWTLHPRGPAAPPQLSFRQLTFSGHIFDAVLSPDGKFLAHVDNTPDGTSLHLMSVANGSDTQIMPPAIGCCQSPSFSPDGSQVYFLENHALKSIPVLGGQVSTIADQACSGAGFSPDGSQIAYIQQEKPIYGVLVLAHPDGSAAHVLNRAPTGQGFLSQCWANFFGPTHSPAWSPDGRSIVVERGGANGDAQLSLINTSDGQSHDLGPPLTSNPTDMNWLPDGRGLVFTANIPDAGASQLWEISVPGGKLTRLTNDLQGYASASLSSDGTLALVHAAPLASVWVQSKPGGEFQQLPGGGSDSEGFQALAWTPAGTLVTMRTYGASRQIWTEASDGSNAHVLTQGLSRASYALEAAPNGQLIFEDPIATVIYRVNADGTGLTKLVQPTGGDSVYNPRIALAGREVIYMLVTHHGHQQLWGVPLAGGAPRQLWPGEIYASTEPVSPDGTRVLVATRDSAGHPTATILRLAGGQPQATGVAGFDAKTMAAVWGWMPDGRAIVYIRNQGSTDNLWALPLAGGAPYALTHFTDLRISDYAFSKDGRLAVSRGSPNRDVVLATGLHAH